MLTQFDNPGGFLFYFFVHIEIDVLELRNDFRQRIKLVFTFVDPISCDFSPTAIFSFS